MEATANREDVRKPTVFDRQRARQRDTKTSLDSLANVLEAVAAETHQLERDVASGSFDLNPLARPRLEERARKLARIRDLATLSLEALAKAGVEPGPRYAVMTGPGGVYVRQHCPIPSCEPAVLGQRLDLEA